MELFDLNWLVGRGLVIERWGHGWTFQCGEKSYIQCECLWRLLGEAHIVLTSVDHGNDYNLKGPIDAGATFNEIVASKKIKAASLKDGTADLCLDLEGAYRVEIIPVSSGHEAWQSRSPDGRVLIAQGGGEVCGYQE